MLRRCLASVLVSKAPTWMIQSRAACALAGGAGADPGSARQRWAEATFAVAGAGDGGASSAGITGSLLTVATVVIDVALASAAPASACGWRRGPATARRLRMLPGCTAKVFTELGLIGSVEPTGCMLSGPAAATCAARRPVLWPAAATSLARAAAPSPSPRPPAAPCVWPRRC